MNCKLGDLAYIKKAIRYSNVGKVVICEKMLGYYIKGESLIWNGEMFETPDTDYFWVISATNSIDTLYGPSLEGFIADSWLRPIRGTGLETETETETEENLVTS